MPPTPEQEARLADAMGLPPQTINNVWGQSTLGKTTFLTLPSGQTCNARVIGLQGVLETGLLGEADSLTAFVGKQFVRKVRGAKGQPDSEQVDPEMLLKSPDTLKKIVKMVDALTPHVVTEPVIYCHYREVTGKDGKRDTEMVPPGDRVPGGIYTDAIPLEDKMFLFNFALQGVKDAESFRQGSQGPVGTVEDVQGVPRSAQSPDAPRRVRRERPPRRR